MNKEFHDLAKRTTPVEDYITFCHTGPKTEHISMLALRNTDRAKGSFINDITQVGCINVCDTKNKVVSKIVF